MSKQKYCNTPKALKRFLEGKSSFTLVFATMCEDKDSRRRTRAGPQYGKMTQAAPIEGFQVTDNKLIAASTEPV